MVCVVDYRFSQTRKVGRTFLFNDVLDTFYLRLYCVGHMVKDHAEREKTAWPLLHQLWKNG